MPDLESLVDPTEPAREARSRPPRLADLAGKRVGILDISKSKGDIFLDRVEELLRERVRPAAIVRRRKPTFAKPAPDELRKELAASVDAVIEGLAD
jgi:hypothetical protein